MSNEKIIPYMRHLVQIDKIELFFIKHKDNNYDLIKNNIISSINYTKATKHNHSPAIILSRY